MKIFLLKQVLLALFKSFEKRKAIKIFEELLKFIK